MMMGLHEWPLMVFTVLAQTAVGAFGLCTLAVLCNAGGTKIAHTLEKCMFFILVFMGIGFLFSTMHLGSPFKALNAFNKIGSAPLSDEGFFGVLFLICAGIAWLFAMGQKAPAIRKILLTTGLVLSVALIWSMCKLYMMPTVPTWNNWTTPASIIATILIGGGMLAAVLYKLAGIHNTMFNRLAVLAVLAGLVLAIIATISLALLLPEIQSSIKTASSLATDSMSKLQAWRFILLAVGVGILLCQTCKQSKSVVCAVLGLCAVLAAEFIGRGVFYGLYMSVGLV